MVDGDANNDKAVTVADAHLMMADGTVDTPGPGQAALTCDQRTGEVRLWSNGIALLHIQCDNALVPGSLADLDSLAPAVVDFSANHLLLIATSPWYVSDFSLGTILNPGLPDDNIRIVVNYPSSRQPGGIVVPINGSPVRVSPSARIPTRDSELEPLPHPVSGTILFDLRGRATISPFHGASGAAVYIEKGRTHEPFSFIP
jgi:hypothetical protein